jgi:hypothetical protein
MFTHRTVCLRITKAGLSGTASNWTSCSFPQFGHVIRLRLTVVVSIYQFYHAPGCAFGQPLRQVWPCNRGDVPRPLAQASEGRNEGAESSEKGMTLFPTLASEPALGSFLWSCEVIGIAAGMILDIQMGAACRWPVGGCDRDRPVTRCLQSTRLVSTHSIHNFNYQCFQ